MDTNAIETVATENVNQENTPPIKEPVYIFRKLNSTDVFPMFKIMGKIGVNNFDTCFKKESIKRMVSDALNGNTVDSDDDSAHAAGISIMLGIVNVIIGNIPKCEQEIYELLSNTSNLSVSQIKELDFAVFTEMVIDFVKKDEFKDFVKVVSKLFN